MNKMQMAHEYAVKMLEHGNMTPEEVVDTSWFIANAMQAKADKRKPTGAPEAIREAHKRIKDKIDFGEPVETPKEYKRCKQVEVSEWQPDWSQAPDNAKYWAMDKDHTANFFKNKPEATNGNGWDFGGVMQSNNSHSYKGNWKDSLRKRPQ